MMKKPIAVLLTVIMLLTLASTAAAAPSSFPDIGDGDLAREVAVLQMLGVIGGDGNGNFNPSGTLTRAAFCKMAVVTMGRGNEESLYRNRTIFHDVRADHWARGFINIAVSGEKKIIAGSGGYFMPDDTITYAQAVTILLRMLGYTDADAGMLWPEGYISLALDTGLTDGITIPSWSAPITRALAARLFCNLLSTPVKGGASYISSLGTSFENVVIMQLDVQAEDGTRGAIRTSKGIYKTVNGIVPPSILGLRGTLLTDKTGKALTFLPDENKQLTITAAQTTAAWIKDTSGVRYDVPADAPAYTPTDIPSEIKTFGERYYEIASGMQVTLFYSADGKAEGVYINTSKSEDAVVAGADGTGSFGWLTGSDTGYKVYKNGAPATLADIRQYDVVTYDSSAKILKATDFRLTACYESCRPTPSSPSHVTLMGKEFPVLPSAIDSLAGFKLGQVVTFLFTSDLQVAGAATGITGSTAVGIVKPDITSSSVTVTLLNGLTLSGKPNMTDSTAKQYAGELVTVYSTMPGQLLISRLGSSGASGDLDLTAMTLGAAPLSPAIKIFERVGTGPVAQLTLANLTQTKISASKILYIHKDYASRIDILVLNDVTGDRYQYGFLKEGETEEYFDGVQFSNRTVSVVNSKTGTTPVVTGAAFTNGAPGGIAVSAGGESLEAIVTLTEVKNVSRASFYTVGGQLYAHLPNMDIMVSPDVECYNKQNSTWFASPSDARAFADTLTVYYDRAPSEGGKIRMIVVG
jgi:hypothetical protein